VLIDLGTLQGVGDVATTVAGVLGFVAPECLHGPGGKAADRWGLGMLTAFMLLGHPQGRVGPDRLCAELRTALSGIARPRRAAALIARMVHADPHHRPNDTMAWCAELRDCLDPAPHRRRAARAVTSGLVVIGTWLVLRSWWQELAERLPEA
jgi:serine/threonine protein kinase